MKSWVSALILWLLFNMQAAPEARSDPGHVDAARAPCALRWRLEQLVLRGGVDDQRLQQTWKDNLSPLDQELRRRKRKWREAVQEESSDFVEESKDLDPDRPDAYVEPEEPVENEDFDRTGHPAFLDPIFEDMTEQDFMMDGLDEFDNEFDSEFDLTQPEDELKALEVMPEYEEEPLTGKLNVRLRDKLTFMLTKNDYKKRLSYSEAIEVERIWQNNRAVLQSQSESDHDNRNLLPWEQNQGVDAEKGGDKEIGDNGPLLTMQEASQMLDEAIEYVRERDRARLMYRGELYKDSDDVEMKGIEYKDNKNDNRHHHHILDNKSQHQVHYLKGQETMSNTSLQDALMAPEDPEPTPNLFDDYEYYKEKKKRIDSDDSIRNLVASELLNVSSTTSKISYGELVSGEPPDEWPFRPGRRTKDNIFDHEIDENLLEKYTLTWDKILKNEEFWIERIKRSMDREYLETLLQVREKWGFVPVPDVDVEGVTCWNSTVPPPLLPPPSPRRDDLILPDAFKTFAAAVWAAKDGERIFLRAGNHTWKGAESRSDLAIQYDGIFMNSKLPPRIIEVLFGIVSVPNFLRAEPTLNLLELEQAGQEESFCLHVTGEEGARLCGRMMLQANSVGSFLGVRLAMENNNSYLEDEKDDAVYMNAIETRGGPWLFQHCELRACGAVALCAARRSLTKIRQSVIGGVSHQRERHSGGGRATCGLLARDFARVVLNEDTIEMTGTVILPALHAVGMSQVSVDRSVFQRNIHSVGVLDRAQVKLSSCFLQNNFQGAFLAVNKQGEVARDDELGEEERRMVEVMLTERAKKEQGMRKFFHQFPIHWDKYRRAWTRVPSRPTRRMDPLLGNVTDGWLYGLPGWTHGVPDSVKERVEALMDASIASSSNLLELSSSVFKWGQVGCPLSLRIANGDAEGDQLTINFNGGSHEASLHVRGCNVSGALWSTNDRPGVFRSEDVLEMQDVWKETFVEGPYRMNCSHMLEQFGFKWDESMRDWLKPVRRADGSYVFVRWNETRFEDEAPGGYPGTPEDYPMFDPETGAEILPLNETVVKRKSIPFLNFETGEPPKAIAEHWKKEKRIIQLKELLELKRLREDPEYLTMKLAGDPEPEEEGVGLKMKYYKTDAERRVASMRLLEKFFNRPYRGKLEAGNEEPITLYDFQPKVRKHFLGVRNAADPDARVYYYCV